MADASCCTTAAYNGGWIHEILRAYHDLFSARQLAGHHVHIFSSATMPVTPSRSPDTSPRPTPVRSSGISRVRRFGRRSERDERRRTNLITSFVKGKLTRATFAKVAWHDTCSGRRSRTNRQQHRGTRSSLRRRSKRDLQKAWYQKTWSTPARICALPGRLNGRWAACPFEVTIKNQPVSVKCR